MAWIGNQVFMGALVCLPSGGALAGLPCGKSGSGDCHRAHAAPGCANAGVCECVCLRDPFCCDVEWDVICVGIVVECEPCAAGPGGSCFVAHPGIPGCAPPLCCTAVCATDPFCCEVEWDSFCASIALFTIDCVPCSESTTCEIAGTFVESENPIGLCAGEGYDWPTLPPSCDEGFGTAFLTNTWARYTATCSGRLTVSTCNDADFDTRMAAYRGDCFNMTLLACNDNSPTCELGTSRMAFDVTDGLVYRIQVGTARYHDVSGAVTLSLQCWPSPDLNGDGVVDGLDLGILLSQWKSGGSADLNLDGVVDGIDLGELLAAWTM